MFKVTPIPAFNDNYIWTLQGDSPDRVAVVDPGDAAPVLAWLEQNDATLEAILVTHHHQDHTGGVDTLRERFEVPVYGPLSSPFEGITAPLRHNSEIRLLGHRLQIRAVPGHTLDHISYFQPDEGPQLFCGDTLFLAGCGRLFEGSAKQMLEAMQYFASLPDHTEVYCTHEYSLANLAFAAAVEPDNSDIAQVRAACEQQREQDLPTLPSTIAQEKRINPFMRTAVAGVRTAAENHIGSLLDSEVEVMAALRKWKNHF
jgi:hydroxyacylglutathione hydrolase